MHSTSPVTPQRRAVALLMTLALTWTPAAPLAAGSGGKPVTVTLGEPSVWSLEQAHYLLERMHAVNHSLNSKVPDTDTLDPNAVNGSRIEVLRTLFAAGLEFNQPLEAESRAKLGNFQSSLSRRNSLQARLDEARTRRQAIAIQLATLRSDLSRLTAEPGASAELRQRRTEEITALEAEQTALGTEVTSLQEELKNLTVTAPEIEAPNPSLGGTNGAAPDITKQSPVLDKVLEGIGSGVNDPQLHVSAILDNHIQMQYELIAKQLSLLRDEVGPDQRVVFLELPVSIYTVPKKADRRLVRVKWTIQEACGGDAYEAALRKQRKKKVEDATARLTSNLQRADQMLRDTVWPSGLASFFDKAPAAGVAADGKVQIQALEAADFLREQDLIEVTDLLEHGAPGERDQLVEAADKAVGNQTQEAKTLLRPYASETGCQRDQERSPRYDEMINACSVATWLENPRAQVVDLVPRQSALNVNQIYDTSKGISLALKALWFGWGASAQFQRQREKFEQFVHQDVFGSGFGKGESTFGWTFGPLPGTERIAPGVRATYAVVVVPRDAVALKLKGEKVAFNVRESPDEVSSTAQEFLLRLPTIDEGFFVRRVSYAPVEPGKRVMVFLSGEGFSPQMGVLVNGVPLKRAISIGRPALVSPIVAASFAGEARDGVDGEYEVVNSHRVILSFSGGPTYEGTPTIVLVTPQKSSAINHYQLSINSEQCTSLIKQNAHQPMFLPRLAVADIDLPCPDSLGQADCVEVRGRGFRPDARIWINGVPLGETQQISTARYRGKLAKSPTEPHLDIIVRQGTRQGVEEASVRVPRPNLFRIRNAEILDLVPGGRPGSGTLHLRVDVVSQNPDKVKAELVGQGPVNPILLSTGELFFKNVKFDDYRLLLELKEDGTKGSALLPVVVPAVPQVTGVTAATTGKPTGATTGNYLVTIRGNNLQDVKRVFFGTGLAAIQRATPAELIVTAPTGPAGMVLIRLETDIRFLGRLLDNAGDPSANVGFTYEAPKTPPSGSTPAG